MPATLTVAAKSHVFGIHAAKPPKDFPEGKLRFRLRQDEFGKAYVWTPAGIRKFYIKDDGENWIPSYEVGRNQTA